VVVAGISLPSDCRMNNISVEVSLVGETRLTRSQVAGYACEGYILPVLDPDGAASFDTLWDNLVTKDTDVETLDLDTSAVDSSTFWEPGEIDLAAVFDVGLQPQRIFQRQRFMTLASHNIHSFQDNQTPFDVLWYAGDTFRIKIGRNLRVRQPSVILFAIGSPALDDTITTAEAHLTEAEWPQVKYFGEVLNRAMLHQLGLIEPGSETPWEEATTLIKRHLDPDFNEVTADVLTPQIYHCQARAMFDHTVPGELGKAIVSTGR